MENITGGKFGRLTVIGFVEKRKRHGYWECRCECGKEIVACGTNLKSGHTSSCGCYEKEKTSERSITHGMHNTKTYKSWACMIQRCTNPKHDNYDYYGGRGITVCPEWLDFNNFYRDMGPRPNGTTIDRIDENKGYFKDNCRWANKDIQANNKRNVLLIQFNGKKQSIPQWSRELQIPVMTIRNRLFKLKWPVEKALIS